MSSKPDSVLEANYSAFIEGACNMVIAMGKACALPGNAACVIQRKKKPEMSHLQKIVRNFVRDYDLVLLVGCDTVFMFCPCWLTVA